MFRPIFWGCLLIYILLHIDAAKSEECSEDLIPCDDKKCVKRNDWCNGNENCEDGSDEAYCKGLTWWGDSVSKESLEGYDSAKTKATEIPSTTVSESFEDYDYDEKIDTTVSVSPKKTTLSDISRTTYTVTFTTESPRSSPNVSLLAPTSEKDFYAKKIEGIGINNQHSTPMETVYTSKIDLSPTFDYRRSYVRPTSLRTTRQINIQYQSTARPYRIRSYRNRMNVPLSSRNSSPYRGSHPIQQPRYIPNNRYPYGPVNNNIPSRPNGNDRQRYRNSNYNNGRTNWQNDINNSPTIYKRQRKVPAPFYFRKNYDEIYHADNALAVDRAKNWILSIRNASGGWGNETPRALIALSLANNSFLAGTYENDLMHKYFQVHLAANLLKEDTPTLNRLAMFVNALIATCQDPRDFHGWDLTELIRGTIGKLTQRTRFPFVSPLVYLSLCLADRNLTHYEIRHLMTYVMTSKEDEATRDMAPLVLEAFACHLQKEKDPVQYQSLLKMVWNTTSKIILRMKEDGSFGSIYSTALVTQALMSVNDTFEWKPNVTFQFLKSHQQDDGSFGDFLATYYILPALSGRSLLHLRNTRCNPPKIDRDLSPSEILQYPGQKHYVHYSLYYSSPLSNAYTIQVLVPSGISFFDVMRVAEYENSNYKFSYEEVNGKINVYSISDIPNDSEQGYAWRLYVKSNFDEEQNTPNMQEYYSGDIREFHPTADQHVIFWYHANGAQF
ncbi:uncharacterized protein TNIN_480001 [Trichonephila inaurata madagascariensis]|uniref:Uncharacterized protein n=1 Tax=Trichonephila inaurata madagascariensis TaxID=2747483 RepID=A0A8X6YAJ1_9ARAC|nr:uncharacterized protein TNIN_480001 [Trichonephila inaurata madagascariensis]